MIENIKDLTAQEIVALFTNKSEAIRYLLSKKLSRSEVAKMLDIRYQHVRNVELQVLKKKDSFDEAKILQAIAKIKDNDKDSDQLSFDI